MIIACIVLSSLALLAAVANIILFVTEKKRRDAKSEKQRIDMLNYVHAECDHIAEATSAQAKEYVNEKVREVASLLTAEADSVGRKVARRFERAEAEIEKLKEEFSTELVEIMRELGRWYNINIVFTNKEIMHDRLHFQAERKGTLEDALDLLNTMQKVNARIEKDKVVIGI